MEEVPTPKPGRGEVEARTVIGDVLPLAEIGEAFRLLSASGRQKVLIDCREA